MCTLTLILRASFFSVPDRPKNWGRRSRFVHPWYSKVFTKDQRCCNRNTFSANSNISANGNCDWSRFYQDEWAESLKGFDASLELTEGSTRNILKNMYWVKRKESNRKVEPCTKFLEEEKFSFQRTIFKFVSEHDTSLDMVLRQDWTPLSYVSSGSKYKFDMKVQPQFPSKVSIINDKWLPHLWFLHQVQFYLPNSFIMLKQSVVYPNTISLIDHWLQIIGAILKSWSACLRKLSFPILKRRKKDLLTQVHKKSVSY